MRTKHVKYLSISLCVLLLACSACGASEDTLVLTPSEDSVAVEDETAEVEGTTVEEEDIVYDVNNLSEKQQDMMGPMDTWIYVPDEYWISYGQIQTLEWDNSAYAWFAIWLLLDNYYDFYIKELGILYGDALPESLVKECASALFADFDGELTPIPADGPSGLAREGDGYRVMLGDRGEGEGLAISAWTEHPDGSCTVEVQHVAYDLAEAEYVDTTLRHQFELMPNAYTANEADPIYVYSIVSMDTYHVDDGSGSTASVNSGGYILPESDIRYYTISELNGLSTDQLRLARNEIYARHGRKFDSEDLQSYFNGQPWYQGTVAASDFDDSVLNQYEKANVETIQAVEATR